MPVTEMLSQVETTPQLPVTTTKNKRTVYYYTVSDHASPGELPRITVFSETVRTNNQGKNQIVFVCMLIMTAQND